MGDLIQAPSVRSYCLGWKTTETLGRIDRFGAGADRLSEGMRLAFGSSMGRAARVSRGQVILSVSTYEKHTNFVRDVLRSAAKKLPCTYSFVVSEAKRDED
ncbi:MAG: ribosomal protein L16 [Aigarchaeota archaeon]|nr:ribosomal protein L16 [Aigarchaeota archaeon]